MYPLCRQRALRALYHPKRLPFTAPGLGRLPRDLEEFWRLALVTGGSRVFLIISTFCKECAWFRVATPGDRGRPLCPGRPAYPSWDIVIEGSGERRARCIEGTSGRSNRPTAPLDTGP